MAVTTLRGISAPGLVVREERLLQHPRAPRPSERVVLQPERLEPAVLAEALGRPEEPHLARGERGLEQRRLGHPQQPAGTAPVRVVVDLVGRQGFARVLHGEGLLQDPQVRLLAGEALLGVSRQRISVA